jgi:hypothetical protein
MGINSSNWSLPGKSKLTTAINLWWVFIAAFGLQILFLQRRNVACIPLGITLALLGLFTFAATKRMAKASGAMVISMVLLSAMSGVFQSTQTMFAFYVSLTALFAQYLRTSKTELLGAYMCAISGICDLFAGLNKLLPSSSFYRGDMLRGVLGNNLFPEPAFLINLLVHTSPFIALLEVVCGILVLFFPFPGLVFALILHAPIAVFTADSWMHLLALLSYAAMFYYALSIQFLISHPGKPRAAGVLIAKELKHNLISPMIRNRLQGIFIDPFMSLLAFQISLPSMLLVVRIITGRIYGYGFGWQMFS